MAKKKIAKRPSRPEQRASVLQALRSRALSGEGITTTELVRLTNLSRRLVGRAIQELRDLHGKEGVNIPAVQTEAREEWRYYLVADETKMRWWSLWMAKRIVRMLKTVTSMSRTLVNITDGRTPLGKAARKIHRTTEYLEKELTEVL